ncbi:MAG: ABC transporter ATP-binding protein, partial [Clostridia bacterium]|nr:ABC transporter ATP-binding protein [Clostridia bacterium]
MEQNRPFRKGILKRFLPYYKKYLGILIFDLFCAALTTACDLTLPMLVRQITDLAANNAAALTLEFILKI